MEYHKEIKKSGRMLQTRGPRDSQCKLESELIVELRRQIGELKFELKKTDTTKEFTAEQMDHEIRKAVRESLEETKVKNEDLLSTLKVELDVLKEKLSMREELINALKMRTGSVEPEPEVDLERPQIKKVFVDPLDVNAGKNLEAHIDVEDVSLDGKENIYEKVDKLKNLLGGFKK